MKNKRMIEQPEAGLAGFLNDLWKTFTVGPAPKLYYDHLVEADEINRGLKHKITRRANIILNSHPNNNHKFGKSGQPPRRVDWDEYRKAPYSKMFLLFKSKNHSHISSMEVYYIKRYKHLHKNDNVSELETHTMKSHDGFYYMYIVV